MAISSSLLKLLSWLPASWVSAVGPFNNVILMYDGSHEAGQERVAEGQLKEAELGTT